MGIKKIENVIQGGFWVTTVSAPGFVIPAGTTAVSMPLNTDWVMLNTSGMLLSILGIPGVVNRGASGLPTFTRTTAGIATSVPAGTNIGDSSPYLARALLGITAAAPSIPATPVWTSPASGSSASRAPLLTGTTLPNTTVTLDFSGAITGTGATAVSNGSGVFQLQLVDNGSVGTGALSITARITVGGVNSAAAVLNITIPAVAGGSVVGNPSAFSQELWKFNFSAGNNGQYRLLGGSWNDFSSWPTQGNLDNGVLYLQGNSANLGFFLDPSPSGVGKTLRSQITPGQMWNGGTYPRSDVIITSNNGYQSTISKMVWGVEYRREGTWHCSGDLTVPDEMVYGFQMHHNGGGSQPYGTYLTSRGWEFWARTSPNPSTINGPFIQASLLSGANPTPGTAYDFVLEVKHETAGAGAYLKFWLNGVLKVNITGQDIGYRYEDDAGQLKVASNYDYRAQQTSPTNLFSGPVDSLFRKP